MKDLILLAASGLAREVMSARQDEYRFVGILDDDPALHGTTIAGVEVLGGIAHAAERDGSLLVCAGSGVARRAIVHRLSVLGVTSDRYATFVDASVAVTSSSTIGRGTVILAQTVMTADVTVGEHVVLMPSVVITHDDVIGDFATLAAGTVLGGSVVVGEAAYLGMNSSVRQRVVVGTGATIGMGSVVLDDVPSGETWIGVPARAMEVRQ